MLERFHSLLPEIIEFRNLKKCPLTELEDENWLCDLGFMVVIIKHLNDLNKFKDQSNYCSQCLPRSNLSHQCLSVWENQLKDNDCRHFHTLEKQNPTSCAQYALECSGLLESFNARFHDIKNKQLELDIFSIAFNVTPASAPSELQLELIKLRSDDTLKAMYLNKPLLKFYHVYVSKEEFPGTAFQLAELLYTIVPQAFSSFNIFQMSFRIESTFSYPRKEFLILHFTHLAPDVQSTPDLLASFCEFPHLRHKCRYLQPAQVNSPHTGTL